MTKPVRALALSTAVALAACPAGRDPGPPGDAAAGVEVRDARARATAPGAAHGAAFMVLDNRGKTTALVGARTAACESVELHTHARVGGVMTMRPVERIEIAAGERTVLEPGGLHLMFLGLARPLRAGEALELTLVFEDGSETTIPVDVRGLRRPASPR